jgi:putative 4-mercaptohistidine N1-methyltranferase
MGNPYESDRYLHEYLLFHFGTEAQWGQSGLLPAGALSFAQRCVTAHVAPGKKYARALDLGCAVGGSSFELSKICDEVVAIDFSHRFIQAAQHLQQTGTHDLLIVEEGELSRPSQVQRPSGTQPEKISFRQGDAQHLPADLGLFDLVLLANLIDRLPDPQKCLEAMNHLVRPGGQLIITSPYTWLESFTPKEKWLGGYWDAGRPVRTLETLRTVLAPHFIFQTNRDLPFLIREHARKFQWSVAEASLWIRR